MVSCSPARQDMLMRKVAMCGPSLPCLISRSLDQPGETSVACSSMAYCVAQCQGESWPSHKKVCNKMKWAPSGLEMDLVSNIMMTKAGVVRLLG